MLNSSEGRWRKRLHQPDIGKRKDRSCKKSTDASSHSFTSLNANVNIEAPSLESGSLGQTGWVIEKEEPQAVTTPAPPRGGSAAVASLIVLSLVTYILYHASVEALVGDNPSSSRAVSTSTNISGRDRQAHHGGSAHEDELGGLYHGVSVVTVSAWQSMVALSAGFVLSRARGLGWRRSDVRTLNDTEKVTGKMDRIQQTMVKSPNLIFQRRLQALSCPLCPCF